MTIKAIIFDMDGVLINSEYEYIKMSKKFLESYGVEVKLEDMYFFAGSPRSTELEFITKKLNLPADECERIEDKFFAQFKIDYLNWKKDYVDDLLEYLKNNNIKVALASSSKMNNIEQVLKDCKIGDYFSYIVSGEMFVRTKPDPEIYEYTTSKLCLSKDEILVVEDSTYGITASKAAGLKTVAVIDPVLNFDNHLADYKVKSLKEIIDILEGEK